MVLKKMGGALTRTVASGAQQPEGDSEASLVSHGGGLTRSRRAIIVDEDDVEIRSTDDEEVEQTLSETEEDEAIGNGSRRRLHRLGSDVESPAADHISRRRSGVEASCGYASSPSPRRGLRRGHADNVHGPSALRRQLGSPEPSDTELIGPKRRKLAPLLVADVELESPLQSPEPMIDKPREERSYREFFPDLNTSLALPVVLNRDPLIGEDLTPQALADVDSRLGGEALSSDSLDSSPLSDISSSVAERPAASRTSSSLSIRLVFNDPESPAQLFKPQSPLAGITVPPPLRSAGKSARSYPGTPQSSVVVLAPKKPLLALPEARFRHVGDEGLYKQTGFRRPESHYIRNAELTEKDLAGRVEYDLDEVDREWLQRFNHERTVNGVGGPELLANALEELIDNIEKTWFDLVKDVQKSISAIQQDKLPPEESACAICGEEECDNTNAIVFCDGCNLAVHQECYGVPYIPEGQWLCRKCMLSPDTPISCVLCPQTGGAFKKTTTNKWAHLLCALWIPEVGIANSVYMEPIDSIDQIPRSRWKLYCNLCHRKVGACIQCSQKQCVTAFHATCARKARLSMSVRADRRTGDTVFRVFCERHTPLSHTQTIDLAAPLKGLSNKRRKAVGAGGTATPLALSAVSSDLASMLARNGSSSSNGARLSLTAEGGSTPSNGVSAGRWPESAVKLVSNADKEVAELFWRATGDGGSIEENDEASLQLTMRIFNPDHPVINDYAFRQILDRAHLSRMNQQHRMRIATSVCRFWALKRFVRHGAPLLKRLHLEPWTASATKQRASEMAEEQRQEFMRRVRTDLERVRMLVESVRRRERDKLRRAKVQVEYLQTAIDPVTPVMKDIIAELADKRDPRGVFAQAVSNEDAPDYDRFIKEPMDFGTVRRKIAEFEYHRGSSGDSSTLDLFERDLRLVCTNCMAYNKPTTYYFQLASRVLRHIDRLLAAARKHLGGLAIDPSTGCLMADIDFDIFALSPPLQQQPPAAPPQTEAPVASAQIRSQPKGEEEKEESPMDSLTVADKKLKTRVAQVRQKTKKERAAAERAFRRLTLFEKMSLPPPDVRQREISQFMNRHPSSTKVPHSEIPDDANVLKDRLRRASQAPLVKVDESPVKAPKEPPPSLPPTPKKQGDRPKKRSKPRGEPNPRVASVTPADKDTPPPPPPPPLAAESKGQQEAASAEEYRSGTMVWVKAPEHAWFPGEIIKASDWRVPEAVREMEEDDLLLVRLFKGSNEERRWKWFAEDQIRRMGVDKDLDMMLFIGNSDKKKEKEHVRLAYREAFRTKKIKHIINTRID
ncbi:hypothetical protein IW152_005787 [Coemansia sp. BCRC 34962]|nr:hypothetical protein IW152_005787 [Coemansia sp. BCRC 34962]